jgi:hypothetical protein
MVYFKGIYTKIFSVHFRGNFYKKNALGRRGEITSVQGNEIKMYH